ncbi:MAG: ribonuclease E/G [Aquisalinus sp.]|nr:ribonuclease E/G [Aquisalinus sp.]
MTVKLLIEDSPAETRAALIKNGQVWSLWFSADAGAGGLYLGKVKAIDRKLRAAFVDIGFGEAGFLPMTDAHKLCEGESIPVRIKRPAAPGKGPLLTTQLGIESASLAVLLERVGNAPAKLDAEQPDAVHALRYFAKSVPSEIIVSGSSAFLSLQAFMHGETMEANPGLTSHTSSSLFELEGVEESIEQALARIVTLPGGGRLIFDEAEALTAVDVDVAATQGQSKRGSIIKACLEAIPEIFRQLSLRRIGGQVVIDFPSLAVKGGGQIRAALKEATRTLPGARLIRLDDTGLAIFIIPKRKLSLLDLLTEHHGPGPVQGRRLSAHALAAEVLRKAEAQLQRNPSGRFEILAGEEVIVHIASKPDWQQKLTTQYGVRFSLSVSNNREREWSDVREVS